MVRRIEERDRDDFFRLSAQFYDSPAVLHPIPAGYHEKTFEEMMRSRAYADGCMLEADGECVGFGLVAKTWSREAGGMALWLEELFILPQYRSRGLEEDNTRARALYARLGYCPLGYLQMVKDLRG